MSIYVGLENTGVPSFQQGIQTKVGLPYHGISLGWFPPAFCQVVFAAIPGHTAELMR